MECNFLGLLLVRLVVSTERTKMEATFPGWGIKIWGLVRDGVLQWMRIVVESALTLST